MVYGLTYLYRASDFFSLTEAFQPACVLFTPYWCKLPSWSLESDSKDEAEICEFLLVDCYEFGFMGAFGMGYKLLVLGQQRSVGAVSNLDNKALWSVAEVVRQHALKVWRRILSPVSSRQVNGNSKSLVIRPGFLCELKSVSSAFVKLDSFLKDKIPECVPVVIRKSEQED